MNIKKLGLFTFALLIAACSSNNVTTDYETSYDFSALKTFYVLPADEKILENRKISELDIRRIGELVPLELATRYSKVEKEKADFWVRYFIVVEEKMRVDSYNASFGYYRYGYGYRYGVNTPDVKNTYYQQGSIIIDILDAKTEEVVWRGVTENRIVKRQTPDERRARITEQLAKLFSTFPPAPGGQ